MKSVQKDNRDLKSRCPLNSVQSGNGKHRKQNSKLRAENHKTHDRLNGASLRGPQNEVLSDVKPRTENAEHTTDLPFGPVLYFNFP